jgi:hypothetical protein
VGFPLLSFTRNIERSKILDFYLMILGASFSVWILFLLLVSIT